MSQSRFNCQEVLTGTVVQEDVDTEASPVLQEP
uniref:Benenodin family lasso peptide n=1 Tax=Steinernema glaseri TaxID=37863 RepID=A0A1I7YJQ4_9BILA